MTTFIGNLRCIIGAYFLYLSYTISYPITPLIRISQGSRPQPIILLLGLGDLPADEVSDALRQDHVTAVDMNSGEVTVFEFFQTVTRQTPSRWQVFLIDHKTESSAGSRSNNTGSMWSYPS